MRRRLAISPAAQRDLVEIRNYIAVDNPARAETYLAELLDRCSRLVDFQFAAPDHPRRSGWRSIPYGYYVILYSVTDRTVRIRAVRHSATLK